MAYYPRDEQETIYVYQPEDNEWSVYSTHPPHIRTLLKHGDITETVKDTSGKEILVSGTVATNQIRLFKPRL